MQTLFKVLAAYPVKRSHEGRDIALMVGKPNPVICYDGMNCVRNRPDTFFIRKALAV